MQPPADATRILALRVYRRHPQQHAITFVNYVRRIRCICRPVVRISISLSVGSAGTEHRDRASAGRHNESDTSYSMQTGRNSASAADPARRIERLVPVVRSAACGPARRTVAGRPSICQPPRTMSAASGAAATGARASVGGRPGMLRKSDREWPSSAVLRPSG